MNILSSLIGGITLSGIKGVFEGVGSLAKDIRSAVTGEISPEKKAELLDKVAQLEAMSQQGQFETNKAEATHRSIFVAGWRPFIGWICGVSIAAYFIPQYLLAAVLWVKVCWSAQTLVSYPIPEPVGLITLLTGMLGLGVLRTVEKIKEKSV